MTAGTTATLVAELARATPIRTAREQHLALALYRLLADGDGVDRAALAEHADLTRAEVDETLRRWSGAFFEENQRIVSFHGLSLSPTRHRLIVEGRTLYAWCAWDTLFLPELLGRDARIQSRCPTTLEPVSLSVSGTEVTDRHPATTVLSFLHRDGAPAADPIATFCRYVHFFAAPGAADEWTARHDGTFTISLAEGIELARLANRARYPRILGR